jgi:tRNA G46 methylase TrmB
MSDYLELKKQYKKLKIFYKNKENYIDMLKKIYPHCKHDEKILSELYKDYSIIYGEMEYDGIETICNIEDIDNSFDTFIDIGSGRGKIVLYMATKFNKSIGIEIVKDRYNNANNLLESLNNYSFFTKKVKFVNDDVLNIKFTNNKCLIFMNNTCFTQNFTDNLFIKLLNEISNGSIIMCNHKCTQMDKIKFMYDKNIPMSWNKNNIVYFYKINK